VLWHATQFIGHAARLRYLFISHFGAIQVCDGQTDRQRDGRAVRQTHYDSTYRASIMSRDEN